MDVVREALKPLKHRVPLLHYLDRHHWKGQRGGIGPELVGLCPFHEEQHASFYVNTKKNLFFCHSRAQGSGLIRLVYPLLDGPITS
jgi:DNA primase